ncbi:MAG: transcriptional regulator [Planctomycetota bacterium]|nr:MAG: transcriptional regulator [Planctomycetota bacterium]
MPKATTSRARRAPDAEREVAQLRALGDATRWRILRTLSGCATQRCACDIEACFDLAQPTISHHLKVLRAAGLVRVERRGTWQYYQPERQALRALANRLIELGGTE